MHMLELKDIHKSYGKTEVLKGISFTMNKGETKVIIGTSGTGKSTLLRCINQLDPPDKGEVFLEGEEIDFSLDVADLSLCSEFQQLVLRAEHRIPRGSISTYQLIAKYLGKRNAARAVGNALANNPFPLIVPCHRAIRSDRHLGGYQGGLDMKRALLEKEGIPFDNAGRVVCPQFHYETIVSNRGVQPTR